MTDFYIGEIRVVGFNFAPPGWAFCDGQLLPISQNAALFSVLGTTYGGDGVTTFALPNLTNRVPVGPGVGFVLGEAGGEDMHELTMAEMPAHNHAMQGSAAAGRSQSPSGAVPATVLRRTTYAGGSPSAELGAASMSVAGSDQAHENRSPFLNVNFIIALAGVFPARP